MNRARNIFSSRWAAAIVGLALWLAAAPLSAVDPGLVGPTSKPADIPSADEASIKTWFSDLANSDAGIRADALTHLMGLDADNLPTLKKIVEESRPLVPAQTTVLHRIVTQVFLAGEHYEGQPGIGFLGVKMAQTAVSFRDVISGDTSLPSVGVIIVERMPGFVGARMLEDGDVILSILDSPNTLLTDTLRFTTLIKSMGAGSIAHFQVLRQGQVIHVDVKLDPRPIEADGGFGIDEMLEHRRQKAEEFWTVHFAELVKEGVS